MSAEVKSRVDETPKEILLNAVKAIQGAQEYLSKATEATYGYDPEIVTQIRVERESLDAFLTQLSHAGTITDDDLFAKATGALKLQAPSLHAVSDQVKKTASDIATAPGVSGYMEQTVTFIQQAAIFISELP